ncbi:MAG TPA: adenylate/guanylate cyclase domain-containing protein [Rubricoccaceae bacterium]
MTTSPDDAAALRAENARLRRAVDELSVLNAAATAMAQATDLGGALEALVARAVQAARAEQGVLVLVDETAGAAGVTLVRSAMTTAGPHDALRPDVSVVGWIQRERRPLVVADVRTDPRFRGVTWPEAARSVVAAPLLARGRLVGVLALYNRRGGEDAFTEDDAHLLGILGAQSAQAVERMRLDDERARVVRLFGQHTDPAVVEVLLGTAGDVEVRRQDVCVMFLDLRGFTLRSEAWEPEAVVDYLNAFFDLAVGVVHRHGGMIHQLLGDGFMALFGVPTADVTAARRAVQAAREILQSVDEACAAGTLCETQLGIGVHAGEAVTGPVGSALHREYKVTGDVVNVTARIEKLCKTTDARLLVSDAVWERLGDEAVGEPLGPIALDGRRDPVVVYRLA